MNREDTIELILEVLREQSDTDDYGRGVIYYHDFTAVAQLIGMELTKKLTNDPNPPPNGNR